MNFCLHLFLAGARTAREARVVSKRFLMAGPLMFRSLSAAHVMTYTGLAVCGWCSCKG